MHLSIPVSSSEHRSTLSRRLTFALAKMGSHKQDHSLAGLVRQVVDWPMQTLMYVITYIQEFLFGIYTGLTWDKRKMRDLTGWTILVMGASDGTSRALSRDTCHLVAIYIAAEHLALKS